jgi:hypothetical protein
MKTIKFKDAKIQIDKYFENLTKEQFVKDLRNAGFEVVDVESEEDSGFEMYYEELKKRARQTKFILKT